MNGTGDNADRGRFQFTIARLLACTTFAALAAWAATAPIPLAVTVRAIDREFNLLPLMLTTVLLAASSGVLVRGKPGVSHGARVGCGLLIGAFALASVVIAILELVRWLI